MLTQDFLKIEIKLLLHSYKKVKTVAFKNQQPQANCDGPHCK
jgi:hypothetical protein